MNVIEEMRDRLTEKFSQPMKSPLQGLRVTADNMPRMPQSKIPHTKPKYDTVGRPPKKELPEVPLYRKKPRDIWGGWL